MKWWPWALGGVALAGAAAWWFTGGDDEGGGDVAMIDEGSRGAPVYVKGDVDMSAVHPELTDFVAWWRTNGPFPIKITDAGRNLARQRALFAIGRTEPGTIVTNAETPRDSGHGLRRLPDGRVVACALDVYPAESANVIVLNYSDPRWPQLVALVESRGLVSLAHSSLHDWPHIEIEGWRSLPYAG